MNSLFQSFPKPIFPPEVIKQTSIPTSDIPPDLAAKNPMRLVVIEGASAGRQVDVGAGELFMGRAHGLGITLEGSSVSRRHSRLWREGDMIFVEDLGSSNGTFVNRQRITGKTALSPNDLIGIGSHLVRLERDCDPEMDVTIQRQTLADAGNLELFRLNSAEKLRTVLELAHLLSRSLDAGTLLERLLTHLMALFPQASRALVIYPGPTDPAIRASKQRHQLRLEGYGFSRSVTRQVLERGVAILAEDARQLGANATLATLGIRSLLCVPLITHSGRAFGVIELDRFELGCPFNAEDLHLLTAIALQVSTVIENATLHHELLENQRIQQDLALAREIQQGFLPQEPPSLSAGRFELTGSLYPAYEVSGDFYDFVPLDERRLALVVADVSGKGMPAALLMTMVRVLVRQLAETISSPSQILSGLNAALVRDNPKFMFVTVMLGIYDVASGVCTLARGGHPPALIRRQSGIVSQVSSPNGTLLGIESPYPQLADTSLSLDPGDTLLFYTDGVTEAVAGDGEELFGTQRLESLFGQAQVDQPLAEWVRSAREEIRRFSNSDGLQDDVTLLLLRRPLETQSTK